MSGVRLNRLEETNLINSFGLTTSSFMGVYVAVQTAALKETLSSPLAKEVRTEEGRERLVALVKKDVEEGRVKDINIPELNVLLEWLDTIFILEAPYDQKEDCQPIQWWMMDLGEDVYEFKEDIITALLRIKETGGKKVENLIKQILKDQDGMSRRQAIVRSLDLDLKVDSVKDIYNLLWGAPINQDWKTSIRGGLEKALEEGCDTKMLVGNQFQLLWAKQLAKSLSRKIGYADDFKKIKFEVNSKEEICFPAGTVFVIDMQYDMRRDAYRNLGFQ